MFYRILMTLPRIFGTFFRFVFIALFIGFASFFVGQLLPRKNFDYYAFPYKPFSWENGGKFYIRLNIQKWKDKMPDMSQYIKSAFRKKISVFRSPEYLDELIRETCVAEFVHWMLIVISPVYLVLMEGVAGVLCMAAYCVGNIPFIMIQRYNRPRLVMLMEKQIQLDRRRAARAVSV